jgi:hypothetical protein
MAIVISLLLVMGFGILEFVLAIFYWSQVVEATRAGARYAIVNDPACDIYGEGGLPACPGGVQLDRDNCPGASVEVTPQNCDSQPDDPGCRIVAVMHGILPLVSEDNVRVDYGCSDAGYAERPLVVPTVTVYTSGVEYEFMLPGLLGIDLSATMPPFKTTRIGEDLYSPAG